MDHAAQLRGEVRIGRVSSVGKDRHTVQVQFFEVDGFVSWDLQVLVTRPGDYSLPAQNTPVLCLIVDGRLGVGYVLGALYTDSDAPPLNDDGKRSIVGDDLRLGAADASEKVAMASTCKQNFDAVKTELTNISTTLASLTGGASAPATFGTAYSMGFDPKDPAADKVSVPAPPGGGP